MWTFTKYYVVQLCYLYIKGDRSQVQISASGLITNQEKIGNVLNNKGL